MLSHLILASSSPYRKQLLSKLGLTFMSISPNIVETPLFLETPIDFVQRMANRKALVISKFHPNSLIIGSDQVAFCKKKIVGKPKNYADSVIQLQDASGSVVTLYTGLALLNSKTKRIQSIVDTFEVEFRVLSTQQIENYLHIKHPYNCCGSFKAEGIGISLLKRVSGNDPNTLIGFPLIQLVTMLKNEGIEPIPSRLSLQENR